MNGNDADSRRTQIASSPLRMRLRRTANHLRSFPWASGSPSTRAHSQARTLPAQRRTNQSVSPISSSQEGVPNRNDLPLSDHPFSSANAVDVSARCMRSALFSAQGASVDALRPACASWIPTFTACVCAKSTTRLSGAICVSAQSPASSGEMRPSGTTAVASTTMAPAPRVAKPYSASSIASVRPSVRLW